MCDCVIVLVVTQVGHKAAIMGEHNHPGLMWWENVLRFMHSCMTYKCVSRKNCNNPNTTIIESLLVNFETMTTTFRTKVFLASEEENRMIKHRKNCKYCHHHSLFKGHNVNVNIVVLNCQKSNQCLKCQVSGHKSLGPVSRVTSLSECSMVVFFNNVELVGR